MHVLNIYKTVLHQTAGVSFEAFILCVVLVFFCELGNLEQDMLALMVLLLYFTGPLLGSAILTPDPLCIAGGYVPGVLLG